MLTNLKNRLIGATVAFGLLGIGTAYAGDSIGHSAAAGQHSSAAVGHAGAATVSGVATSVAVPIMSVGSAAAVSGAAVEHVGTKTIVVGSEIIARTNDALPLGAHEPLHHVKPDVAPSLD